VWELERENQEDPISSAHRYLFTGEPLILLQGPLSLTFILGPRSREKLLIRAGRLERRGVGIALPAFLVIKQGLAFSGIIGSGLCVFSKHPIQEITQHTYTLNGYPYMVSLPPPPP
jgi:hypothetical protein